MASEVDAEVAAAGEVAAEFAVELDHAADAVISRFCMAVMPDDQPRCRPLIMINANRYVALMRIDSRTELVIAVDIAKRLGISPQRVNVLAAGPGFPKPIGKLGRSTVWRWSSIERWALDTERLLADTA